MGVTKLSDRQIAALEEQGISNVTEIDPNFLRVYGDQKDPIVSGLLQDEVAFQGSDELKSESEKKWWSNEDVDSMAITYPNRKFEGRKSRTYEEITKDLQPITAKEATIWSRQGVLPKRFLDLSNEEFQVLQREPARMSSGEKELPTYVFPERDYQKEIQKQQGGTGTDALKRDVYEAAVEPTLNLVSMASDASIGALKLMDKGLAFVLDDPTLADAGPGREFAYNAKLYAPKVLAQRLKADIAELANVENPQTRSEIARNKAREYAGYFTYYGFTQVLGKRIPGLKRFFEAMNKEIKEKPLKVLGVEALGVGTETEIAARGGSELQQGVGAVATQVIAPIGITKFLIEPSNAKVLKLDPSNAALIEKYKQVDWNRAASYIQDIVDNPKAAAAKIDEVLENPFESIFEDIPAEILAGDKGLTYLEKIIAQRSAGKIDLNERDINYLNELAGTLRNASKVDNVVDLIRFEKERAQKNIDTILSLNTKRNLDQVTALKKGQATGEEYNNAIFNAINESKVDYNVWLESLWSSPNLNLAQTLSPQNVSKTKQVFKNLRANKFENINMDDIPEEAVKILGGDKMPQTVGELHALYSKLGEIGDLARREGNSTLSQTTTAIRKAILDDMDKIPGAGVALKRAINASRIGYKTFDGGFAGSLLDKGNVRPQTSFDKVFSDYTDGKIDFQEAIKAAKAGELVSYKDTFRVPAVIGAYSEHIKNLFVQEATRNVDGVRVIDKDLAESFFNKHAPTLDLPEFKGLKLQLRTSVNATDALRPQADDILETATSQFGTKSQAAANLFFNAPVKDRMSKILFAGDPKMQVKQLMDLIKATPDSSFEKLGVSRGDVLQGVKDSVYDTLISIGTAKTDFKLSTIDDLLKDKSVYQGLRQIFNPAELQRLKKFTETVKAFNLYKGRQGSLDELSNLTLGEQMMAILNGAAFGKAIPGAASLQAVSFAKRKTLEVLSDMKKGELDRILGDAMRDPKLYKLLFETPVEKAQSAMYLRKYLLTRGIDVAADSQTEEYKKEAEELRARDGNIITNFINGVRQRELESLSALQQSAMITQNPTALLDVLDLDEQSVIAQSLIDSIRAPIQEGVSQGMDVMRNAPAPNDFGTIPNGNTLRSLEGMK
jgi:hypothetical protein